jgi:UDP-glucose:glycoprotein glucosyltransferase
MIDRLWDSETIALDNADAFFPLVDTLANPETPSLTPEAIYQFALTTAVDRKYLTESPAIVQSSLALHAATPKIEAFYQYYADHHKNVECGSWVDWYGEVVCGVERLAHLVSIEAPDFKSKRKWVPV